MFGKFLKSAKKVQNANLMEAIVAGCMLVAAADGDIEKSELEKLDRLILNNESLSAFKPSEIKKVITKYSGILEADFLVGRQKMMKEIEEISENSENSLEVLLNMLAIASSDGEVDQKEKDVLIKVGKALGVNTSDFDL